MAKIREKDEALKLRTKGRSIGDIATELSVSKSTVSHWCKNIVLSTDSIDRIARRSHSKSTSALLRYSERKRINRIEETEKDFQIGSERLGMMKNRDIFCIGLGLYWGEGYKKGSQEFGFTNSDPDMITFYMKWLQVVFGITRPELILRVSINDSHKNRVGVVQKYWSHKTGVPIQQFTKISLIKAQNKKQYRNKKEHYGTLRIKVRKGTHMRRELLGAIRAIGEQ